MITFTIYTIISFLLGTMVCYMVMDAITKSVDDEGSVNMMYANDVVLVKNNTKVMGGKLGRWREILEKYGLKISRATSVFLEFRFKKIGYEEIGVIIT